MELGDVGHFVLDEADRMLDMGFSKDVERILRLMPERRQNLMFSATMPKAIGSLANNMLYDPVSVDISPEEATTDRIEQYVSFVRKADKRELLIDLLEGQMVSCGIVFTRTKHGANRLAKQLAKVGIPADSIHGDKSQTARTKALARFKNGEVFVLVATDIASRGIDVEDVTHVFNYDLPNEPEVYIHRIGRTARAGREGLAYAFCDESESGYLVGIQRLLGHEIEVLEDQPYHFEKARPKPGQKPGRVKGFPAGGLHVEALEEVERCAGTTGAGKSRTVNGSVPISNPRKVGKKTTLLDEGNEVTNPIVLQKVARRNQSTVVATNRGVPTTRTVEASAETTAHDWRAQT